ncbi:MAG TPA: OmpA family protein [Polyangiaceae bacterium]|nr:OmpA family protein [Polyangiaceae bacterium]
MRTRRSLCLGLVSAASLLVALPAMAQDATAAKNGEFNVQRFESAPGPNNVLSAERVRMSQQFGWSAGLMFNYARDPFVVVSCKAETNCDEPNATQIEDVSVITNMMQWDLMGSFNPVDFIQIGLKVPLVFVNGQGINADTGQPSLDGLSGFGISDPLLEGKIRFFGDSKSPVALGGAVDVAFPLGQVVGEDKYIGDSPIAVGWRGIADFQIGDFFATANLRGIYRGENSLGSTTVGPLEFRYAAGLGYQITPIFAVEAEGFGTTQFAATKGTNTLEADGAVVIAPLSTGLAFTVGGGAGIIEGVGTPTFRVLGGVTFSMEAGDQDGDGIDDNSDKCPTVKEDKDEFEDEDGCPEDDNDKDSVPDAKDKCPLKAETINGFQDDDGCPDTTQDTDQDGIPDERDKCPKDAGKMLTPEFYGCPDTDNDGVPDPADKCPTEAEDTDGFQDTDGCPDPDNDNDGVPDAADECGDQPETKNGFKDEDGCPDSAPDKDGDGIPDALDKCPAIPENLNGIEDEDGCPDKGPTLVEVKADEIKILQRVEFETSSDKIKGAPSFAVLDAVVGALKVHPEITKVEVQGHTDNTGDATQNKDLSQKRADAVVKYLTEKGIAATRLSGKGYGQDKPIADNKTAAGRQKNRRVEFAIQESTRNAPAKP